MFRVELIRAFGVREFTIYDEDAVRRKFEEFHTNKMARHSRDYTRIFNLIYAHALLNCFNREILQSGVLVATQNDIDEGFELYSEIMESNESGVPPEVYKMFKEIFVPYYNERS